MDVIIKLVSVTGKDVKINIAFPDSEFTDRDDVVNNLPVTGEAQDFIDAATKYAEDYVRGLIAEEARKIVVSDEVTALIGKSKTITV